MIENGLEDEARSLYPLRSLNALGTVGYKEFFEFFDGKVTLEKAIELIKRDTRRFAKRQLTWWSKDKNIKWFNASHDIEIIDFIGQFLNNPEKTS
jgi:tRNA dimethylallyltransferase